MTGRTKAKPQTTDNAAIQDKQPKPDIYNLSDLPLFRGLEDLHPESHSPEKEPSEPGVRRRRSRPKGSGSVKKPVKVPESPAAHPFVKWAGGKRKLLSELLPRVPEFSGRYIEPFVGGGALFFGLKPGKAILADTNQELINLYTVIRDQVEDLIGELSGCATDKDSYMEVRYWDRMPDYASLPAVKKAFRFIYLNRLCFNGLYRVSAKGFFNVPYGKYTNPMVLDAQNLRLCSEALQSAELIRSDFRKAAEMAGPDDFVYFDPPYVPLSATAFFTSYTADGFDYEDQENLAELCGELSDRGVKFMLSNSDTPLTRALYERFTVHIVQAPRMINSRAEARGNVSEILVTNY